MTPGSEAGLSNSKASEFHQLDPGSSQAKEWLVITCYKGGIPFKFKFKFNDQQGEKEKKPSETKSKVNMNT